jgi:hypothetical protein
MTRTRGVWLLFRLVLVLFPALGCQDDSEPLVPVDFSGVWLGSATLLGQVLLEVGDSDAVVMRRPGASPFYFPVGVTTEGNALTAEALFDAPTTYRFEGTLTGSEQLSGTFTLRLGGTFPLELNRIPAGQMTAHLLLALDPSGVLALAFDRENLWLSTTENYLVVTPNGTVEDTVDVFYTQDAHWTSPILTFGHDLLWGTIAYGTSSGTRSRVLPFNRTGIVFDQAFVLPHISSGLAHDGEHLWSLEHDSGKIFEVTEAGAVIDSLDLHHPDLYELAFDGAHFWSVGWYVPRLYEFDRTGALLAAYVLPDDQGVAWWPAGLAADSSGLFYGRGLPGAISEIYRFTVTRSGRPPGP